MTSLRKIEANQRNARFSTGPKSRGGRARARRNALKSGLYAKMMLLPSENALAYRDLRIAMFEKYEPRGPIEEGLIELIIADLWRLDRLLRIENEFIRHTESKAAKREKYLNCPKSIDTFLGELRGISGRATTSTALPANSDTPLASGSCSRSEASTTTDPDAACLLDAHISPVSQTPMEDIARQRRHISREMLRNIAAINVLQSQCAGPRTPVPFIGRLE